MKGVFAVPSPYQRNTRVASSSDFVAKSEDEATLVRRWYDPGTAMMRSRGGDDEICYDVLGRGDAVGCVPHISIN